MPAGDGLAETQMLNISSLSSNSKTSGQRHSLSGEGRPSSSLSDGSDKSDSDWDSWDDDEEEV